jgi:regulator of RNase E activity RraB
MRPETEAERQARHAATIRAYRELVDPAAPPRAPHLLEQHFFCSDEGDMTGLIQALEAKGFHVETFAYDPDHPTRTWTLVVVRIELLEEPKLLRLSDEMDALARQHNVTYDGWVTHVDQ